MATYVGADNELIQSTEEAPVPNTSDSDNYDILKTKTLTAADYTLAKSYKFDIFDVNDLKDRKNFSMSISAKRCSGKTIIMKDLLYKMRDWYTDCFVFSKTAKAQPDMYDFCNEENVYDQFDETQLLKIFNGQKDKITKLMKKAKKPEEKKKMPHILLILDDMIGDKVCMNSKTLMDILVLGRHYAVAIIIITQTFTGIPKALRSNMDCAISFFLDNHDDRDNFCKSYLSTKNKRIGMYIFDNITKEPYQAIICENFRTSQNPEDLIKTYVAKQKVPKFKIQGRTRIEALADYRASAPTKPGEFMPPIRKSRQNMNPLEYNF